MPPWAKISSESEASGWLGKFAPVAPICQAVIVQVTQGKGQCSCLPKSHCLRQSPPEYSPPIDKHTKGTLNVDPELGMVEVEIMIFGSTLHILEWRHHKTVVDICKVAEDAKARSQESRSLYLLVEL
jgi:hypothetical protein